jgi:hypothetical protein
MRGKEGQSCRRLSNRGEEGKREKGREEKGGDQRTSNVGRGKRRGRKGKAYRPEMVEQGW